MWRPETAKIWAKPNFERPCLYSNLSERITAFTKEKESLDKFFSNTLLIYWLKFFLIFKKTEEDSPNFSKDFISSLLFIFLDNKYFL